MTLQCKVIADQISRRCWPLVVVRSVRLSNDYHCKIVANPREEGRNDDGTNLHINAALCEHMCVCVCVCVHVCALVFRWELILVRNKRVLIVCARVFVGHNCVVCPLSETSETKNN